MRNDLVMQLASGREAVGKKPGEGDVDPERPLASASTLCRLENRVDRQACVEINKLFLELYIESHGSTPPTEIVLDFDATNNPIHGHQDVRFYEQTYCARGEIENRIKEQQLGLFADRTSCHDFISNQFRLLLTQLPQLCFQKKILLP